MSNEERWEIAVIRKELMMITENMIQAVLLNQILYWTNTGFNNKNQHVRESELSKYLRESLALSSNKYGWIYKGAPKWKEELMLQVTENTIRESLQELCYKGFISRKKVSRPGNNLWEYRLNLMKVLVSLLRINFPVENYIKIYPNLFSEWAEDLSLDKIEKLLKADDATKDQHELFSLQLRDYDFKKKIECIKKRGKNKKLLPFMPKEESK